MGVTVDNIIGVLMFPFIMIVGIAAFISTIQSKGTAEMTTDDWISAVLAGSTVLVGGSFHVFPMNHGEAGTAAICILMPFGGLAVLSIHLATQILEPSLGAFLPRVTLSPWILYGIVRVWQSLLGMEATAFNVLLLVWIVLIAGGWVGCGWWMDQSNSAAHVVTA